MIPRLYVSMPLESNASLSIEGAQAHYLATVLRRKVGDSLLLFNGKDGEFSAVIQNIHKKTITLLTTQQTQPQPIAQKDIWLLFAPIKKTPVDYLAQKATELGATALCPILTERTIARRINEERLYANCLEAAEQTGRFSIPALQPLQELSTCLQQWDKERFLLFCDEARTAPSIQTVLKQHCHGKKWAILIGPEGGFSENESRLLQAHPATLSCHLGNRILRADTAAIAALAIWQSTLGDWETKALL